MHWPAEHPLRADPALAPWAPAAATLVAGGRLVRVLRHLERRRVASLVETPDGPGVLKVFARPRARGNDRRLRVLAATPAAGLVPRSLGVDPSGHVSLVAWSEGDVYAAVPDPVFVAMAPAVGAALRALHSSGAELDRSWDHAQEIAQLRRRSTPATAAAAERVAAATSELANEPLVPAHRDCHPRQVVVHEGAVRWIDLDDAAMAPAALDVGNFVAHLRRDGALGRRSHRATAAAVAGLLAGYGPVGGDLDGWARLALARLAALAETRHGQPDEGRRLLELAR